jgi:alkylation response protein AidB-like acyl-CoA dehydrogenase
MSQPINRYKADLREFKFILFEQLEARRTARELPMPDWGEEEIGMVIDQAYRFATEVTGPLNAIGDKGCRLENGQVFTPPGFKEAWTGLYEQGFKTLTVEPEYGGQGAPRTVAAIVSEMLSGSNPAFEMYSALTLGAAEVIAHFGTDDQKHRFVDKMYNGTWAGTMCLTEPHAGSDVGLSTTSAKKIRRHLRHQGHEDFHQRRGLRHGGERRTWCSRARGAQKDEGPVAFIVPKLRADEKGNITGRTT